MDNKEEDKKTIEQEILSNYNNLTKGWRGGLFDNAPQLSHGKYVQLSAYEEKKTGAAVTTANSSILSIK